MPTPDPIDPNDHVNNPVTAALNYPQVTPACKAEVHKHLEGARSKGHPLSHDEAAFVVWVLTTLSYRIRHSNPHRYQHDPFFQQACRSISDTTELVNTLYSSINS